jgi:L-Ala-D/L-Glu epimerase
LFAQNRVSQFRYGVKRHPLKRPYVLSMGVLDYFDSVWILIEDEKSRLGIGEAVPLPGYSWETLDDVLGCLKKIDSESGSLTLQDIERYSYSLKNRFPFAASALMTAIESRDWLEKASGLSPLPLVFPIASEPRESSLLARVKYGLDQGYLYFKMKVGADLAQDIQSSKWVLSQFPQKKIKVSFDANQGYALREAIKFCEAVEEFDVFNRARFVEQLLPLEDWNECKELCSKTSLKIMLDESIYDEANILQAKKIGCGAIKLKLFKHYGLCNTLALAKKAFDLGLEVVLGNGVSTDIGNLCEALIVSSMPNIFVPGAECNGYLKIKDPAIFPQLQFNSGNLIWKDGMRQKSSFSDWASRLCSS